MILRGHNHWDKITASYLVPKQSEFSSNSKNFKEFFIFINLLKNKLVKYVSSTVTQ
jgi:hypothetical protein